MYNEQELIEKVEKILSPKRFKHCLGVMESAEEMAKKHGVDIEKARIAALMHDIAKEVDRDEVLAVCSKYNVAIDDTLKRDKHLIHGPLGAAMCEKDFGILDEDILDAIKYHTIAKPQMSDLDAIIYLADIIEPYRKPYKGIDELRQSCRTKPLDEALLDGINSVLSHLLYENKRMHYKTIEARNYLITKINGR